MKPSLSLFLCGLFSVTMLSGCGDPEKIEDLSNKISNVSVVGTAPETHLRIRHFQKAVLDEEGWLAGFSFDAQKINKGIVEYWPNDYATVTYFVDMPVTDSYGNTSNSLGIVVTWTMDDLKKINWNSITHWQLLNLAQKVEIASGLGRKAMTAYCVDDSNLEHAKPFCMNLLKPK